MHLKNIEAELDAQMAKVEQQALAKAKQEYEVDRRTLQQKMDAELTELQTQLKLFQKVRRKFYRPIAIRLGWSIARKPGGAGN